MKDLRYDFDIRKCIEENSVKIPLRGETAETWKLPPGMVPVKFSDIDCSKIYRPFIPLQIVPLVPDRQIHLIEIADNLLIDDETPARPTEFISIDAVIGDDEQSDPQLEALCQAHDDHFWPHKNGCPLCGSDAYVGFSSVECSMSSCRNFVWKEGM